ncbi:ATP-binding protein [Streptomyces collinus]|uniref:Putative ATP/GTP binding protein n=1 Tax=Streptomyces collinus (strain DSM 40733 / Tue 365) TaxID=1214242 RepID=S5VN43_STRC3|nr:ATP-binding protein [Streptomyces collinus]AGS72002.1 putative ATP/GTP binding protein [Streptomyces collinus Tu 365]UJA10654.1 ATP-binding protein [Streptomyces collinus]UJA14482.1 ATP-binding protein [Streptomyces collinus]
MSPRSHLAKPPDMFARDWEWSELTAFAADEGPEATMAVVSGRRRQGKSFLLDSLARAAGGFYFCAYEATEAESLRRIGEELGQYSGSLAPMRFDRWEQAVDALLALGKERPVPVVIDEFPYLARATASLPSILQVAYGPRRPERLESRTRMLLCGSSLSFMGRLLSGTSPLRGRAGMELVLQPLDFRQAAAFWGIDDPRLALLVHSVVGGTPAYRREFVRDDTPAGPADFDAWVCRTALSPSSPLYREARYLLADESDLRDRALYHSVLAALASGNATAGRIAACLERPVSDITHPLTVLQDCGLVRKEADAFRRNRSVYRVGEPLIAFDHAISRPRLPLLDRGMAEQVWRSSRPRFLSAVVGPHFEQICREWVAHFAAPETFGGMPIDVTYGTVPDQAGRTSHEIDVVVRGAVGQDSGVLLSLGEAKWDQVMGVGHLERLRRAATLLDGRGVDVSAVRLACYSGAGFTEELRDAGARGEVVLVDLRRLYGGE